MSRSLSQSTLKHEGGGVRQVFTLREFFRAARSLSGPVQLFGAYLMLLAVQALFAHELMNFGVLIQACLLLLAPRMLGRMLKIAVPASIELMTALLVAATLLAGELMHLYDAVWWWDIPPHFLSGFLFAAIARMLIVRAYHGEPEARTERIIIIMVAIIVSVGVSALWELYEFGADTLVGTHMQPSGADTMHDVIAGTAGALLAPFTKYLRFTSHS